MASIESTTSVEPTSIDLKPPSRVNGREREMNERLSLPSFDFRGATLADCEAALDSSSKVFMAWSQTSPHERRRLLQRLSQCLRAREAEVLALIQEEIKCPELWARINFEGSVGLIEEAAALVSAPAMQGSIPYTELDNSYAFVFTRPLGVVLGIAPWNSPLVLGFRSIIAPIAAGNTTIFKGSELSPRTHTLISHLFDEAGFPRGVVNLILHKPEDAPKIVEALISHPCVRKVNFTGSMAVGRVIGEKAGRALKPVLLELGGKNCSVILADADVRAAAKAIMQAATLNGGQICMSTDLAIVVRERVAEFKDALIAELRQNNATHRLMMPSSYTKLESLVSDAESHGAAIYRADSRTTDGYPVTVIDNVDSTMAFFRTESFGPVVGIMAAEDAEHAIELVNGSDYGLSAAIWTRNHHAALKMAQALKVGAAHINSSTIHDEATLPHGGMRSSGFGRFGASWGLQEFVETQTITLHP